MLQYMFLRRTINPRGRFFFTWEIFRIIVSAIVTILLIGRDTIFIYIRREQSIFFRVVNIVMIVDLYIRMHCQFFNKNGILVSHPWSTMKHYLSTSFTVDFLSYFPANFFGLNYIFGISNARITAVFIRIILQPLQMHRFFSLLTYLHTNINNHKSIIIQTIKYSVLVFTVIGVSSVILVSLECTITVEEGVSLNSNWYYKLDMLTAIITITDSMYR